MKEKHHSIIKEQLQKIGCSCDWSMKDSPWMKASAKRYGESFVTLYERGLIYKGEYLVNYFARRCGTALADDEVEYQPVHAFL